ncbi:MAG: hypothetical protein IJT51_03455, partial [Bacteroidales bacterium]|nr:hypothetical protein [Bacteroidales bacterium]
MMRKYDILELEARKTDNKVLKKIFSALIFTFLLLGMMLLNVTVLAQTKMIYVSNGSGNDSYDGSASYPVKTLYKALDIANSSVATAIYINMASGTYSETSILDIKSNLHIEGGFMPGNWLQKSGATVLNIDAAATAEQSATHKIGFRALNVTDWSLKDLTINIPSASDRATNGKGTSVYGVYVNNSGLSGVVSPHSQIVNCILTVGNGYAGINGTNGANGAAGSNGGSGGDGHSSTALGGYNSPGSGGTGVGSGNRKGGNGGAGGNGGTAKNSGSAGNSGSVGGNNNGGSAGVKGNGGSAGNSGTIGSNGGNGANGITTILDNQHVWGSYFLPADKGNDGVDGRGGGGGGG